MGEVDATYVQFGSRGGGEFSPHFGMRVYHPRSLHSAVHLRCRCLYSVMGSLSGHEVWQFNEKTVTVSVGGREERGETSVTAED